MDELIKNRNYYKGKLQKIQTQVNKHDTIPISNPLANELLSEIAKIVDKHEDCQEKILAHIKSDEEIEVQVVVAEAFQTLAIAVKLKLLQIKEENNPTVINNGSNVKLPRIDLPTFYGQLENWQSFQDLFIATVETNKSLSNAQKLQYLKSCVRGEAADLIKSFAVTDQNYREAWGLLTDRYDNKREVLQSLMKKLHNQAALKEESASGLQKLLDTTNECLRSMRVLGRPVDSYDDFLVYLVTERMDAESRRDWALSLKTAEPPTYSSLQDFLEGQIRGLMASGQVRKSSTTSNGERRQASSHFTRSEASCPVCTGDHPTSQCAEFKRMSTTDRSNLARKLSLCFNCLRSDHSSRDCKNKGTCRTCNKHHHTLLHFDNYQASSRGKGTKPSEQTTSSNSNQAIHVKSLYTNYLSNQTILKTALVRVKDNLGLDRVLRAVLDDGSEATLITDACAKSLGLSRNPISISVCGVSESEVAQATSVVSLSLSSLHDNSSVEVEALVLPRVTGSLPQRYSDPSQWNHIKNIPLADPNFNIPAPIDMLIGADATGMIIRDGKRSGLSNEPTAHNTMFGWVISGKAKINFHNVITINHAKLDVEEILQKFWEVEELPKVTFRTEEEEACEKHFQENTIRNANGKFVVRLPFKTNADRLGDSKKKAIMRLCQVEKRLARSCKYKEDYYDFMKEYAALQHMKPAPPTQLPGSQCYYLPHHFVLKQESSTTKFRVVFDGSAQSSSGISLNDILMTGPTIQDDLFSHLLRFRFHPIAMKADITKMYRQFLVHEDDQQYQRILWRNTINDPIKEFNLTTVTYGISSSSFLATRCLQQLSKDVEDKLPIAARALRHDMYVDDLMSGAETEEEALQLQHQLVEALKSAGMEIRKWSCSNQDVLKTIPADLQETKSCLSFDTDGVIKALGVGWNPGTDKFIFSVQQPNPDGKWTKRRLSSDAGKNFDPLGLLAPCTIKAKIILQDLWKINCDWDEIIPSQIQEDWITYSQQLNSIKALTIPRCVLSNPVKEVEFHGFCDASEKAYAAAVYVRCVQSNGDISCHLLTSKTKVVPIKKISLPRLELCGAVLLAELIEAVKESTQRDYPVTARTDSTICIGWFASFPGRWQTFVANRVSKIQAIIPFSSWRHVRSEENPADLPSRGMNPEDLIHSTLWWNGPAWLAEPHATGPDPLPTIPENLPEEKKVLVNVRLTQTQTTLLNQFSSFQKLTRITAWLVRYVQYLRKDVKKGPLTTTELSNSRLYWIRSVQCSAFTSEVKDLKANQIIKKSSKLQQLNPYLDNHDLLRVGGRLLNAEVPEDTKHPLILPHDHLITRMIIQDCHQSTMHGGFKLVFSTLQRKYHILRGRETVRHLLRKCVKCRKVRATVTQQLMGNLPSPRVILQRPFLHAGVDYAGPFNIRTFKGRGNKTFKCYFAVFVCLATKAVHLEAVTDLTSEAFIASFKRFSARRGVSSDLYSDCGTNFCGADNELKELLESCKHNDILSHYLTDNGTNWHFNPPSAPHQGGIWEAGVKSVKYHLRRVVGETILTLEEFQTFLCLVEATLNSRPLCALSSDPMDFNVLTPGHFLVGGPLTAIPEPDLTHLKDNRLSRWQHTQKMFQHFWKRWNTEYLTTLQQRYKWTKKQPNLQVGDLVTIKDDNLPPLKWKMGRVIDVHPGSDDCVRVVTLQTQSGEMKRPIAKLCPILFHDEVQDGVEVSGN